MTVRRAVGLGFTMRRGYNCWHVFMGRHECCKRHTQRQALGALIALAGMMATL